MDQFETEDLPQEKILRSWRPDKPSPWGVLQPADVALAVTRDSKGRVEVACLKHWHKRPSTATRAEMRELLIEAVASLALEVMTEGDGPREEG